MPKRASYRLLVGKSDLQNCNFLGEQPVVTGFEFPDEQQVLFMRHLLTMFGGPSLYRVFFLWVIVRLPN
jgi:hypothetical protein